MKAVAGIFGLTGVALGAFGAHALKARLAAAGMTDSWDTAVQYHLIHSVALLALAAWASSSATLTRPYRIAAWTWIVGVVLFSGSIYVLALGGPRALGPVTPVGGVLLLIGWASLLFPSGKQNAA
jgi:Uncharacterized small membrane protein